MTERKSIHPRISDQTHDYLERWFRSKTSGAEYLLDMTPGLFARTLNDLKGQFERGELMLMIDVFNATFLTPQLAGQHLYIQCLDGMELDGLDAKWKVKKDDFLYKLKQITLFEAACLEIWANGFWYGGDMEKDLDQKDFDAHIAMLMPPIDKEG